jgi:tetratricopeptide (TPR) repeat protein
LTHDYLVHSLREWLTRKQKESKRGRAELLLADRAAVWTARPEIRQLPSFVQWARIRLLTARKTWTTPQAKMMRKAGRYFAVRSLLLVLLLGAALGWAGLEIQGRRKAYALRDRLLEASTTEVPGIVKEMAAYRRWLDPLLRDAYQEAEAGKDARKQLHASLALLPVDSGQKEYLYNRLLNADVQEVPVLRAVLAPYKDAFVDRLWVVFEQPARGQEQQRLRAACALATYDAEAKRWAAVQDTLAFDLVKVPETHLALWWDFVRSRHETLVPALAGVLRHANLQDPRPNVPAVPAVPAKLPRPGYGPSATPAPSFPMRESEWVPAMNLVADYAADKPQLLLELLLAADERQFAILFARCKDHGETMARSLLTQLRKNLDWNDPDLNPSWTEPGADVKGRLEAAQGLLAERFAYCQTMPLDEFIAVAEQLRPCGYRPARFRPHAAGKVVHVAAVWTRDGQNWQLAHGQSAKEIRRRDAELRAQSFQPADVTGYLSAGQERYAALWTNAPAQAANTYMEVGMVEGQASAPPPLTSYLAPGLSLALALAEGGGPAGAVGLWHGQAVGLALALADDLPPPPRPAGYSQVNYSRLALPDGKIRTSSIWAQRTGFLVRTATEPASRHPAMYHPENLQVDVQLSPAAPIVTGRPLYTRQLAEAQKDVQARPDDIEAYFRRGRAYFDLGDNDKALADLAHVIAKAPRHNQAYVYRALVHARLGKRKEAGDDLVKMREVTGPVLVPSTEAIVAIYAGQDVEGLKRLEADLTNRFRTPNRDQNLFAYNAACTYSVASHVLAGKDPARAKQYADRAVTLLDDAFARGFRNYQLLLTDSDMDPVRGHAGFQAFLDKAQVNRLYTALWHQNQTMTSTEVVGLDPVEQRARGQALMAQGFRPVALAVAQLEDGRQMTASVWQRPLIREADRAKRAKERANTAVALLRLNHGGEVWPLLKHSPDPTVRSYLIERLGPCGTEPQVLLARLEDGPGVSVRRALLLSLGQFSEAQLPPAERQRLLPRLAQLYREDPDPGIHGAADWLLRKWQAQDRLRDIDQALTTGRVEGNRHWYVNRQGLTLPLVPRRG